MVHGQRWYAVPVLDLGEDTQIGCHPSEHAWTQLPPTFSVFAEALLMAASTLAPVEGVELELPMFAVGVWLCARRLQT